MMALLFSRLKVTNTSLFRPGRQHTGRRGFIHSLVDKNTSVVQYSHNTTALILDNTAQDMTGPPSRYTLHTTGHTILLPVLVGHIAAVDDGEVGLAKVSHLGVRGTRHRE